MEAPERNVGVKELLPSFIPSFLPIFLMTEEIRASLNANAYDSTKGKADDAGKKGDKCWSNVLEGADRNGPQHKRMGLASVTGQIFYLEEQEGQAHGHRGLRVSKCGGLAEEHLNDLF